MHGVLSLYGRIPASSKETSGLLTQTQFVYWLQRHVLRKAGRIRTLPIDGIDMLQPFRRPCFPNNGIGTGIVAEHNLENSVSASLHCRHDDVIKWKHFPRYWSFVQGSHRWIPLTKASDAELWYFLWSAPWINSWVNNRGAGDLRCHRAHYDVIVMGNSAV